MVGSRDNTKLDLEGLRARLQAVAKTYEAKLKVVTDKAGIAQLDRAGASLLSLQKRIEGFKGGDVGFARLVSGLSQVDASLERMGGTAGGGLLSAAAGGFASLSSSLSGTAGTVGLILVPLAALAAIMAGPLIASLLPLTLGFAAFAAGAVGEIQKVLTAHQKLLAAQQAYAKATTAAGRASALRAERLATEGLTGAEKDLLGMLGSLERQFGKLEKAVRPEVVRAFASGIRILKDLMPALIPLAQAAGKALDGFLKHIDSWLRSDSGKKFLRWMQVDGPHAIETFGKAMWITAQVIGRTFAWLRNAGDTWWKNFFIDVNHVHDAWSRTVNSFVSLGHQIEAAWNRLVSAARTAVNAIRAAFSSMVSFITGIPGRVAGALGSVFRPLIAAGQAALSFIRGIVAQIEGALSGLAGAINSALGGIPGKVLHFLGLETGGIAGAAAGTLSSGWKVVGEHGRELVKLPPGAQVSSNPDTERILGQGPARGAVIQIEWAGGNAGDEFMTWLRRNIRIRGGGNVQKALGGT